jgi:heparan-alpha-glucosaminide N-acetyltransferase
VLAIARCFPYFISMPADESLAAVSSPSQGTRVATVTPEKPPRLVSLDAYRGFVMLLMASDGLNIWKMAKQNPGSSFWAFLSYQTEHVDWRGCALWDLIQPSFMFMVGVALPFSLASRKAKGESFRKQLGHVIWRSLALTFLGVFLRSVGKPQTYFTFEDVLSQIGLGYTFLFLLSWTKPKVQFTAALLILVGYWAAFALYPLPGPNFDYHAVGVPADWPHLTGFAAHWDKNTNFAAWVDQWFLNLFPREHPFVYNGGGYLTLSFIPSLATMLFGLLAGQYLRSPATQASKVRTLIGVGIFCLVVGAILDATGICPSVKRIWTPSWVIFSTGWTCILLATFYGIIDWKGYKKWAFFLVVVGMNSIAMYVMDHLWDGFIKTTFKVHFGPGVFNIFGAQFAPMTEMLLTLVVLWSMCYWMYRKKLFIKI